MYVSLDTNFVDDATNDITFVYETYDDTRAYAVTVYNEDCETAVSTGGANPVIIDGTGIGTYPDIGEVPDAGTKNTLTTIINLDKTYITDSNIYDSATDVIKFCAVIQLLSGADEIKREERVFTVPFDYNPDFAALGDAENEVVTLTNTDDGFIEGLEGAGLGVATADIVDLESFIAACKCDTGVAFASSADCSTNTLDAADNLNICIYSKDTDIELVSVTELDLDGGAAATKPVIDGGGLSDGTITAYLDNASTDVRVIETIVPDEFFYADNIGTALTVSGIVLVELTGNPARRHLVKFDTSDVTESRAVRGLNSPPFAKSLFGADNTDTAGESTEGTFSFDVELTNKDADNEEFIDISSGSTISAAAGALAAVAVSYFW